ncbi:MAG: DNA-3-methyladenine glycosylase 2 family protein [Faecalibacterium sp.]|nr:DNA-3-methyladenine glycosylase 2 family protein [Ruminococcus sp.]MCM1392411.1 DNA-3-methyladenine glycosylase 2 family protein [Ruminococcus sp.]MCM1486399.1 DNA-3-methyladenine glycosylase 2 family protein [Faecalibacterium sp.]
MIYNENGKDIILKETECLNIGLTVDCGQSFRWTVNKDSSFHGIVNGKAVDIIQSENEIIFKDTDKESFEKIWIPYFDLNRDYKSICKSFDDAYLKTACSEYYGIRILKQDPWEAICSFIISQNNNIPRIKGIISRLCETFGEQINENDYSFPSYETIAKLNEDDLSPLRAGFRNKYIIDAARKLASGEVSIEEIEKMPIEQARQELMKIKGIGAKVAECSLLYGFGRVEAFPIDVWVKRIMKELYPNGLPLCTKGVEGIAQQYLFHWRRQQTD